jgi:tetratricopeptide (TPR) repeat protein
MRYHCIHCDERFELAPDAEKRCPKCMRVHGIREQQDAPATRSRPPRRRRVFVAGSAVVLAALAVFVYALWRREMAPDAVTLATKPLSPHVVSRELARARVKAGNAEHILAVEPAVQRFARAASGASTDVAKLKALVEALRARADKQAIAAWSLGDPREGPSLTANGVAASIEKDGARVQLYPLEVAALVAAALRANDVDAMLVEIPAQPGERAPRDPSGRFGYYGVGLPDAGDAKKPPRVFDVYAQKTEPMACTECKRLGDLEAVGAALSLQATQKLAQNLDPADALRDADAAIKLLPSSPSVRSARGAILLANGASEIGQSEFEAALQMRGDGPRRNNVAMLALALGDSERATREVAKVLEAQPDFALAHVTLAQVYLATGDRDSAARELDKAEAIDPRGALLPMTRAQLYAVANQSDQAIAQAKRALAERPKDPQAHLLLGRIYRQAGRYDEMRAEARTVMTLVPAPLAARTRDVIAQLLGPTALEASDAAPPSDTAAAAPSDAAPDRLELDSPSDTKGPRLRLLDPQSAGPSAGTLNPAGGAPRLRLGDSGSGSGLRLKQP